MIVKQVFKLNLNRLFVAFCFAISIVGAMAQTNNKVFNVKDFGAISDTSTISTTAIQNAIDSCYKVGGGTVYFPSGDFMTGTIILKDNVVLEFDVEATLYASRNIDDYRAPLQDATRPVMIYANGAKNIGISGNGEINGNARRVYEDLREVDDFIADITENARQSGVEMKRYYVVPPDVAMIIFYNCQDITMEGVSLVESSFWTLHMIRCQNVLIQNMYISSSLEQGVNADGIDINSCQNVTIQNCTASTGDDAIALKTRYEDPCENIRVSNCVLTSSSTAIKLGTESFGDFRDIRFENCQVLNSNRGLSIVIRNGGTVEDVLFSNISIECKRRHFNWWGNGDPIWIYLTKKHPTKSKVGLIKDVVFENISATGMGTSKVESTEGMRIENIRFSNVNIEMRQEDYPDKRADHAFFASNVNGLFMNNCNVQWDKNLIEEKWESALYISDCSNVEVANARGRQGLVDSDIPAIVLSNTSDVVIKNYVAERSTKTVVKVIGEESKNVKLLNIAQAIGSQEILDIAPEVIEQETIQYIR